MFICDEVQAAWGRTGEHWWGIEHWDAQPDIMVSAKGMGNGTPVAMTIATPEVADKYPGITFATFGGNPVSMAAARSTIEVIEEQNLLQNCKVIGAYLGERFKALMDKHPLIGDARGMGLMQAIELVKDRKTKEPAPQAVIKVFEEAKTRGVLIGKGGVYGNVIRTGLMLNAGKPQVDELVEALDGGLALAANLKTSHEGHRMNTNESLLKEEVYAIIGAAIEAHKQLGAGFAEAVYQEAMEIELRSRDIPFDRQVRLRIQYKGVPLICEYVADLVCFDSIIIELKAIRETGKREEAQIINYLRATRLRVGLLINFGDQGRLDWQRFVF